MHAQTDTVACALIGFYYLHEGLHDDGLDRAYHAHQFIFSFLILFFCLFRVVD